MSSRVTDFMEEMVNRPDDSTAIVSHGNSLIAIVHWWLGLGEEHWTKISYVFEPGSITTLTVNRWGEKTILKLNDTSHLVGV